MNHRIIQTRSFSKSTWIPRLIKQNGPVFPSRSLTLRNLNRKLALLLFLFWCFVRYTNTTATDHQEPHPHPNPPPEGEGILWGFFTFMEGFPIPPLSRGRSALHHAVYLVGCTICPEPYVVQDRVQDKALNLTWFRGGGWGIYVAVVLIN